MDVDTHTSTYAEVNKETCAISKFFVGKLCLNFEFITILTWQNWFQNDTNRYCITEHKLNSAGAGQG